MSHWIEVALAMAADARGSFRHSRIKAKYVDFVGVDRPVRELDGPPCSSEFLQIIHNDLPVVFRSNSPIHP